MFGLLTKMTNILTGAVVGDSEEVGHRRSPLKNGFPQSWITMEGAAAGFSRVFSLVLVSVYDSPIPEEQWATIVPDLELQFCVWRVGFPYNSGHRK